MKGEYIKKGYFLVNKIFEKKELKIINDILSKFHSSWVKENTDHYNNRAVNSAYLTGSKYLDDEDRIVLFNFISSRKILDVLYKIIPDAPAFMNTQLFFNPANPEQKNYWHRDIQYNDYSVEYQKEAINKFNVVHFRIPLKPEAGLEVVPGSHKRWDTDVEFDVRLEQNGRKNSEDLESGKKIIINMGGLLVFSANIIHRGIYGLDRFIFDILFCDSHPELLKFCDPDCLPGSDLIKEIDNPNVFLNSLSQ